MQNFQTLITMKKLICLLILMSLIFVSCIFAGIDPDKKVQAAYWLRMNGKADAAKGLLDSILSEDSTLAMAYYEKARLNHYILLGRGEVTISDILVPAGKAVQYDPSNVTYAYYKALVTFFNAYFAMQTGQGDPKTYVDEAIKEFEKVLAMKPDYHEAALYLVEFYGLLPADMGGDSAKAVGYAEKLATMDGYYGAKAKAVLATQGTDLVKFWEDLMVLNGKKPDYLMEAGKACLFAANPEKAEQYFNQAIQADPSKNILILDLARYHIFKVMQNDSLAGSELPLAKTYFEKYLNTKPEPVVPLKAYATGWLGQTEMFLGNQTEAEKRIEEAKAMDPYFSRASGIPTLLLFDPPDQISHHYFSFFSWF
jgi:tetratricopeptide (TPR) repeat protein